MAAQLMIPVPNDYGYVLLSTSATFLLLHWHSLRTGKYRRAAKCPLPDQYAGPVPSNLTGSEKEQAEKKAYLFNCAQRAHGNYLENHNTLVLSTLIAGLRFPIAASVCSVAWSLNRIAFMYGYTMESKTKGQGRLYGFLWMVFQFANIGMSIAASWSVLNAGKV